MPKKKSAKKAVKGKKGKKKSAKPKQPEIEVLKWPWQDAVFAWYGHQKLNQTRMRRKFRHHYLYGEGIVCSQSEWVRTLYLHKTPLKHIHAESMVQLLVTALVHEGDSKTSPDDRELFAAALRYRHDTHHFQKAYQQMRFYFSKLDTPENLDILLHLFQDPHRVTNRARLKRFLLEELEISLGQPKPPDAEDEEQISLTLFEPIETFLHDKQIRLVDFFRMIDRDRDGYLTTAEVLQGFEQNGIPLTPQMSEELFELIDLDDNDGLNYQEMALFRLDACLIRREKMKQETDKENEPVPEAALLPAPIRLDDESLMDAALYAHYITRP